MELTFNPFSLKEKRILITGASSGIGKAIAIACSKFGASVIITGRNKEKLDVTYSLLIGENNLSIVGDLTCKRDLQRMLLLLPQLDGVVHSAGMGHRKPCKLIDENDVDNVLDINFKAPVLLQAILLSNKKIKKNASIVFIASHAANSPSIGNSVYSASKGAIISYARCLALEMASRLIRVNCICPAMVWTDLIYEGGLTKEDLEKDQLQYPLKRYGDPNDVANLTVYLLSEAASWMTGACIDLTGGSK